MKRTDTTETYDAFDVAMITIMCNLHRCFSNGPVEQEPWWSEIVTLREFAARVEREAGAQILDEQAERCPSRTQERRYRVIAAAIRERGGYITPVNDL